MKRAGVWAVAVLLSASWSGAVYAAPVNGPGRPTQQGLQNARKAMQWRLDRDKKIRELKAKGQQKRKLAQAGK